MTPRHRGQVAHGSRDRVAFGRMPQTSELLWHIAWIGVIGVGAMLIAIIVARVLRKRLRAQTRTEAFTIQELREMREAGKITPEEYAAMRAAIIGQIAPGGRTPAARSRDPQPAGDPQTEDDTEDTAPNPGPDDQR